MFIKIIISIKVRTIVQAAGEKYSTLKLILKTLQGLESVLAEEVQALGGSAVKILKRAVACEGDLRLLYRANLELRTALRVLMPVAEFRARTPEELYQKMYRIEWSDYLTVDKTFAIDAVTKSEIFTHSKYAALKAKDAIADHFRDRTGKRPDVNVDYPHLRIHLHINADACSVALDSSGDSLHQRGYRANSVEAPLNEVLAAGMILHAGWQGERSFVDPMCGSGTLLIEAAMLAKKMPPQLHRQSFGFMTWHNFNARLWEDVVDKAQAQIQPLNCKILGFDKDPKAVRISGQNIFSAHLERQGILVEKQAFEKLVPPAPPGFLMMNPPYDERLKEEDITGFYKMIGDRLKQAFAGYEAWIISSNMEALKHLGLKPDKKLNLYNGALECKLQQYELYAGSKTKSEVGSTKSEVE
jgi:putative N6-adenine-specific DNA methylase